MVRPSSCCSVLIAPTASCFSIPSATSESSTRSNAERSRSRSSSGTNSSGTVTSDGLNVIEAVVTALEEPFLCSNVDQPFGLIGENQSRSSERATTTSFSLRATRAVLDERSGDRDAKAHRRRLARAVRKRWRFRATPVSEITVAGPRSVRARPPPLPPLPPLRSAQDGGGNSVAVASGVSGEDTAVGLPG